MVNDGDGEANDPLLANRDFQRHFLMVSTTKESWAISTLKLRIAWIGLVLQHMKLVSVFVNLISYIIPIYLKLYFIMFISYPVVLIFGIQSFYVLGIGLQSFDTDWDIKIIIVSL